ncbi:phosphoadenosine phosphosulfate reductase domain-containing protein [Flavobacterium sp. 25HG05S-40]|uniref:phosphoadenosine phosphosulfate reductase domain-containing protein n=1 Tax=Flavobacterium sp. 25HG05S-40 TaxID=3458682 RepID=UPI004043DA08
MKIYQKINVYEAAKKRIEYLFNEFPNVVVGMSGGKDSCVVFNLALEEAKKRNRLPLSVMWLDQEAEFQATADHVRDIMYMPEVNPIWLQMHFKIFNATSHSEEWLECWEPGKEWMREKDPISIKENVFGTDRFHDMFTKVLDYYFPNDKACYIAGVRCEESPTRYVALTTAATYKHITYGKILNRKKEHFTFYPIYDWIYVDVWKAIHDNGWPYNDIYNAQYRHGIKIQSMRVSNLHHETALKSLLYLQEVEPQTWEKLSRRLSGINTIKHLKNDAIAAITDLPEEFESWREYAFYLLENLITDVAKQKVYAKKFEALEKKYENLVHNKDGLYKMMVTTVVVNDFEFTKLSNWERNPELNAWRHYNKNGTLPQKKNKFIHG